MSTRKFLDKGVDFTQQSRIHETLRDIATNTANTHITANNVSLNVDGLETLQTTTNTKLAGGLPGALTGSGNLKVCLQELGNEGSERLNVDVGSTNTKLPSALTGAGNLKVSIQESFGTHIATETKQDALISANHTDLGALATKLDSVISNTASISIDGDALQVNTDGLETLQTAGNASLVSIKTAVEAATPTGANRIGRIGITANESHNGSGTERHLVCDENGRLQVDVRDAEGSLTVSGTVTANLSSTDNGVLDTIAANTADLENVNGKITACNTGAVVLAAGSAAIGKLAANSGVDIGDVDVLSLPLTFDSGNKGGTTQRVVIATDDIPIALVNTKLDHLSTDLDTVNQQLGDIESAVQLIDDAIHAEDAAHSSGQKGIPCLMVRQDSHADLAADGDYMIPTINANGEIRVTSTAASGGATEAKQDVIESSLNTIAANTADLENVNGKITACNTGAVVLAAGSAAIGKLAANSGVDIGDVDVLSLPSLPTGSNTIGTVNLSATDNSVLDAINDILGTINLDAMGEAVIFNAEIASGANATSSVFTRPRNVGNWAILIENTSTNNANHSINLSRSVNNNTYFTSSTDYNTVGERNNVIEFTPVETLGSQKYYKITINNQDSSAHTYKVTVCA